MSLPAYAMNLANFPEMYERWIVPPLFRPWVDDLLDRVRVAPGERVLDVACGTGVVARRAKERVGAASRVVGVDVSAPMLAVAHSVAPAVEWREGNAVALPFDGTERFDVVLCQQGLQFFGDRPAAAREMRRILAPGGRLGVATWRPLEELPFFLDLHRVAERRLGTVEDQRYGFGDAGALERLLVEAGFREVRVERESRTVRFDDGPLIVRLNAMALVGMSSAGKALGDGERAALVDAIVEDSLAVLPRYADGGGVAFGMDTNVATAVA